MNTNKIREALELAEAMADVFDRLSQKLGDLRERNADRSRLNKIREALAELDKAPKVLTDEEIEKILHKKSINGMGPTYRWEWRQALKHARDNGYLAPTAGLTVDEGEQLVKEWCLEWCERVAPDDSDWSDLRARLSAAIEAKNNNK